MCPVSFYGCKIFLSYLFSYFTYFLFKIFWTKKKIKSNYYKLKNQRISEFEKDLL